MRAIAFRAFCLFFFAGLSGSCAVVDQFGSRAYDGNLNTQNAFNQEVLVNIIRASRYQAVSWNPANSLTGTQTETLTTGLPTIFFPANQPNSITNSVASGVTGQYTTQPLATTAFQAGMLTPVDLKTVASLATYYPREVVFFALIAAIDVKLGSSGRYARLINDPSEAYYDNPSDLDQTRCEELFNELRQHPGPRAFFGDECSYRKFENLLRILIRNGLYADVVQVPALQPGQAQANQSNLVTVGLFCFNKPFVPQRLLDIQSSSFPKCGQGKAINAGGTVQVTKTENNKFEDRVINTDTKSRTKQITTSTTSLVPATGRNFRVYFTGIGRVEINFELRSPNGFLSYLGSWYKFVNRVPFEGYITAPAQSIFNGGPYLAILNEPSATCYSWAHYEGRTYCVPLGATHTSMLMDIAVMLRNLNVSPTDFNAPIAVRVTN